MSCRLFMTACACLIMLIGAGSAQAAKTMKIGHGLADSHFIGQAMHLFKNYVEENTQGEIKVELYPGVQLGSDKEVLESIKVGVAHMNLPSPSVLTSFVKDFSIITLPYIFPTQKAANAVSDGPWGQALLKQLEKSGFVGLGFGDYGFRELTNSVRPVTTLEDFKGLKIRTMQNPTHLATFRTLGANPTAMAWGEVFTALQQGVIDGQENPLMQIYTFKLNEVQKYLTLTDHCYDMVVFVVGKKWYESLTADEQKTLQEATAIAQKHMREAVVSEDAKALEGIRAAGTIVTELAPAEKKRIRDAALVEVGKQGKKINAALYDSLLQAISAAQ